MRILVTVAAFVVSGSLVRAGTIDVPADQPTIQQAVNAAASGDVIRIKAGTYFETVTVGGKTVHFKAKGKVVLDGYLGGVAHGPVLTFQAGSTGSSATGLTIRHARNAGILGHGVLIQANEIALTKLTIAACASRGVRIENDKAHLDKCVIEGCNGGVESIGDYVTVERTTVRNDGEFGMTFSSKAVTLKNNRIESIEDGPGLFIDAGSTQIIKCRFKDVTDDIAVDLLGDEFELVGCDIEGGTHGNPAIRIHGFETRLVGNRVHDVSGCAVAVVSGSKETELTKNRFERCGTAEEPTLDLEGQYARLFSNRITDSDGRGIYIGDAAELQGNVVKNGRRDGIYVASNVTNVDMRKNVVTGNLGEGFDFRSAPDELIGNTSKQNRTDLASTVVFIVPISNHFGSVGAPDVE